MMNSFKRNSILSIALISMVSAVSAQQQVTNIPKTTSYPSGISSMSGVVNYSGQKSFNEADLKSKEVSKEIDVPKTGDIFIENAYRTFVIKTWNQQKVKLTTTVYYDGESKLTDEEWLEKSNLSLRTVGSSVKIKSGSMTGFNYINIAGDNIGRYSQNGSPAIVYNSNGQSIGFKSNLKKEIIITVPAGSKLDIESKYSDLSLPANLGDLTLEITNGNVDAENLSKLILRAKYANLTLGDIKSAEIEMTNGQFHADNINDLDLDSKSSSLEMASVQKAVIRSTNDEIEMEEVGDISGRKNYGNLRITRLTKAIDIEGANADIKIRNISASVNTIKLNDRYADIRLPMREIKNYSIDFTGSYSSVYGNFEKKAVVDTTAAAAANNRTPWISSAGEPTAATAPKNVSVGSGSLEPVTVTGKSTTIKGTVTTGTLAATNVPSASAGTTYNRTFSNDVVFVTGYGVSSNGTPSKFTATVGDGKGLKIDIKCQNCTVDFK
jgi:hypothetical protein